LARRRARIHFGPALDLTGFDARREGLRTYKEVAEFVMGKIAELGERDRALWSGESSGS
jgi:hypothetical protein